MVCLIVILAAFQQTQSKRVTHAAVPVDSSIEMCGSSVSRDTYYRDWNILLISLISTVRCSYSTLMPAVRYSYSTLMPTVRGRYSTIMPAVRGSYSTLMPAVRYSYSTLMPAVRCGYSTAVFKLSKGKWQIVSQVVFYGGFFVHLHYGTIFWPLLLLATFFPVRWSF